MNLESNSLDVLSIEEHVLDCDFIELTCLIPSKLNIYNGDKVENFYLAHIKRGRFLGLCNSILLIMIFSEYDILHSDDFTKYIEKLFNFSFNIEGESIGYSSFQYFENWKLYKMCFGDNPHFKSGQKVL